MSKAFCVLTACSDEGKEIAVDFTLLHTTVMHNNYINPSYNTIKLENWHYKTAITIIILPRNVGLTKRS